MLDQGTGHFAFPKLASCLQLTFYIHRGEAWSIFDLLVNIKVHPGIHAVAFTLRDTLCHRALRIIPQEN
jgi:hypothetical protein